MLALVATIVAVVFGAPSSTVPVHPAALRRVQASNDPHAVDLAEFVPRGGTIDHVWYVPARLGRPQIAIAWQRGSLRAVGEGYEDTRRYQLTVWHPRLRWQSTVWIPQRLVVDSPFPIADYFGGSALRFADVTGDRRPDLLVTIGCRGCNHGTEAVSVFEATAMGVRRIYGRGSLETGDGGRVAGRVISEAAWGARDGLVWFDKAPLIAGASRYRWQTWLRWTGRGWRIVARRRVPVGAPRLR